MLKPAAAFAFASICFRSSGIQYTLIGGLLLRVDLLSFPIVSPCLIDAVASASQSRIPVEYGVRIKDSEEGTSKLAGGPTSHILPAFQPLLLQT